MKHRPDPWQPIEVDRGSASGDLLAIQSHAAIDCALLWKGVRREHI
jgi:hypothetical protein